MQFRKSNWSRGQETGKRGFMRRKLAEILMVIIGAVMVTNTVKCAGMKRENAGFRSWSFADIPFRLWLKTLEEKYGAPVFDVQPTLVKSEDAKKIGYIPLVQGRDPHCAQGESYCEDVDDYPEEYIKRKIAFSATTVRDLFSDILEPSNNLARFGDVILEESVCPAVEVYIRPKMAKTVRDDWRYVVNDDENQQAIRVEKCGIAGQECLRLSVGAPAGSAPLCRQKYINRKLLTLKADGEMATDSFKLPSCCVCYIKKNEALDLDRFGLNITRRTLRQRAKKVWWRA